MKQKQKCEQTQSLGTVQAHVAAQREISSVGVKSRSVPNVMRKIAPTICMPTLSFLTRKPTQPVTQSQVTFLLSIGIFCRDRRMLSIPADLNQHDGVLSCIKIPEIALVESQN